MASKMKNTELIVAIALGVTAALILYWVNPEVTQNDIGEPNLGWVILLGAVVALLVWLFIRYGHHQDAW